MKIDTAFQHPNRGRLAEAPRLLELSPTDSKLKEILERVMHASLGLVGEYPTLLDDPVFVEWQAGAVEEKLGSHFSAASRMTTNKLFTDDRLRVILEHMNFHLTEAFIRAVLYASTLQHFLTLFTSHHEFRTSCSVDSLLVSLEPELSSIITRLRLIKREGFRTSRQIMTCSNSRRKVFQYSDSHAGTDL